MKTATLKRLLYLMLACAVFAGSMTIAPVRTYASEDPLPEAADAVATEEEAAVSETQEEPEIPATEELPAEEEPEVPVTEELPAEEEPEVPVTEELPAEEEPEVPVMEELPAEEEPEVPVTEELPAEAEPEETVPEETVTEELPLEGMIYADERAGVDLTNVTWLTFGTAQSGTGYSWDGNGNLHLDHYQGGMPVRIGQIRSDDLYRDVVITVSGENTVSGIEIEGYNHLTIKGKDGGSLRIRSIPSAYLSEAIYVRNGAITIEDVKIDMSDGIPAAVDGIVQKESDYPITIRNCEIDLRLEPGEKSIDHNVYGIDSTKTGSCRVTVEDTKLHVHGIMPEENPDLRSINIFNCGRSELVLKNTEITVSGSVSWCISAASLTADGLTLDADLFSPVRPLQTEGIYVGGKAVISNSDFRLRVSRFVECKELSMYNTKADVTAYAHFGRSGQNGLQASRCIEADTALFQNCDLTLKLRDEANTGMFLWDFGYAMRGKALTFSDTIARIDVEHGKATGGLESPAIITDMGGDMICKGNTELTVNAPAHTFCCHESSRLLLEDGLRILTPSSGELKTVPGTTNGYKTIADIEGNAVKTLKIGKGNGWVPPVTTGYIDVTGVSLDKTKVTIEAGQTLRLNASVLPADASNQMTRWSNSNASVVEMQFDAASLLITGKATGTATITVKAEGGYTASCEVTVVPAGSLTPVKQGLVKEADGSLYHYVNGAKTLSRLVTVNGAYYYFGTDGKAVTGKLQKVGNYYYFFQSNGRALTGKLKKAGKYIYYFQSNGRALKNKLQKVGKYHYYFDKNCRATVAKMIKIGKYYYYFDKNGRMVKNKTVTINKKKYTFDKNGRRK
ncbi:MAG: Ig-like domain-containing protein [Lachnospiraceae bacterium]|nr:Ig-like domain-containing protein [Lachnospiraceae bacterium]